jgi:hypothetical protein
MSKSSTGVDIAVSVLPFGFVVKYFLAGSVGVIDDLDKTRGTLNYSLMRLESMFLNSATGSRLAKS